MAARNTTGKSQAGSRQTKTIKQMEIVEMPGTGSLILAFLRYNLLGQIIVFLVAFAAIILLDILISGNSFALFTVIFGLEILAALLIMWIVSLLRQSKNSFYE